MHVSGIPRSADALIPRAQIAIRDVLRQKFLLVMDRLTLPRPVLAVGSDDHPLLSNWMPALFPYLSLGLGRPFLVRAFRCVRGLHISFPPHKTMCNIRDFSIHARLGLKRLNFPKHKLV